MKNLPYSIDDVRKVVNKCRICAEIKPNFYKPPNAQLVKATQPLERLSLDFKGPLPSSSKNRYILTIVDEFSRFPFAFRCSNIDARTVIACLNQLFAIFGMPSYVHTDRTATFLSQDLLSFFGVVVLLVAVLLCITHPGMASASGITELYGLPSGWHYGLANSIYDNGN